MPNFNPFSSDNEDTSFEQGMPVTQAAKTVSKAASDQAKAQADAAQKALMDQLYGPGTPTDQDPNTDISSNDLAKVQAQANASHGAAGKQAGAANNINPNLSPEEQAEMAKVRNELFGTYSSKFKAAPNGAQNINTNLDQEMEKARKEREQREMQRKQEEEEEEKRKKEEEERQKEELVSPAGKKTGVMFGKKQQQPMAVHLAKIKTEGNRGASG